VAKAGIEAMTFGTRLLTWHHTVDEVPRADRARYPWEKEHQPNMTGTPLAYYPPGSVLRGGNRPPATGDYQPWTPE